MQTRAQADCNKWKKKGEAIRHEAHGSRKALAMIKLPLS